MMYLGKITGQLGNVKRGIEILDDTLHLLKKLDRGEKKETLDCLYEKGLLYENHGDKKRANECYKKALPIAKKINSPDIKLDSLITEIESKLDSSYTF